MKKTVFVLLLVAGAIAAVGLDIRFLTAELRKWCAGLIPTRIQAMISPGVFLISFGVT